ncbi:MAG: hypothetical protein LBT04_08035, partial [Prevotellaceae bacterium]|nr:hypothetical protein [Prevotellaceae bacterium]
MKRTFLFTVILFSITMNAQQFNYDQHWKEIESLSKQGNVKSLLPKINEIYTQAKKDKNTVEIVRSLIEQQQILQQTQEDAEGDACKLVIGNFEKEIAAFNGKDAQQCVSTAVLQSLLAKIYENYAQNTQWDRFSMLETENPPKDIAEWTTSRLQQKSFDLYKLSLENTDILKNTKTENFKKILTSSEDIELYPTLYDVLTMRYVIFLKNNEIEKIATELNITSQPLVNHNITQLLGFHFDDKDKSAFLNCKLAEIENQQADNQTEKAELMLFLADKYKSEPFSAYIYYRAAQFYVENGDKKTAYEICVRAKDFLPLQNNKWQVNCENLMAELEKQNLQVQIDETSLPNEPIAVNITHTNLDGFFYRIYKITETIENGNINQNVGNIVKSGSWELRRFNDFSA